MKRVYGTLLSDPLAGFSHDVV